MKRKIRELEKKVSELENQVTGLEAAFEVTIANGSDLVAKIAHLEEENDALLGENLRWRDGMRVLSSTWVRS